MVEQNVGYWACGGISVLDPEWERKLDQRIAAGQRSEVERRFAKGLDDNKSVKFFMKLPAWFIADTPLRSYNPNWAVVFEDTHGVYLVRETTGSADPAQPRHDEDIKIKCAHRHFESIGVDYAVATDTDR